MSKGTKKKNTGKKLGLKKDNLAEDRIIKNLEKKLKLNKRKSKSLPKSFICDGLDYLLDVCDEESRKVAVQSEKPLLFHSGNESNESSSDLDFQTESFKTEHISKKKKLNVQGITKSINSASGVNNYICTNIDKDLNKNKNQSHKQSKDFQYISSDSELDTYIDFVTKETSDVNNKTSSFNKNISIPKMNNTLQSDKRKLSVKKSAIVPNFHLAKTKSNLNLANSVTESDLVQKLDSEQDEPVNKINSNQDDNLLAEADESIWEDIYGRKRSKNGDIILNNNRTYIAPALRIEENENNTEKSKELLLLKRQIKGLLNRLAESNMHSIVCQIEELYMSNSRNDMNEIISNLMIESIVAPVLTAERLVTEHMMCIAVLHANIGTEVGAHIIMILVTKLHKMIEEVQAVENKELDNLVLMISQLYNFKVFGSQIIYQILEKLINKFTEKEIEIILLILKTVGFALRKDDPLALKELILKLQQMASTTKSSNTRIQFMLDVLLAIKNNNMNKIPQYDQSHIEHLKKNLKTLIRKGNSISQLNLSLEDLLNVDQRGKWWIVGSAWSGNLMYNNKIKHFNESDKPMYSKKILELAKAQRMNTDVRKNIFCILMTAEDYLDAFEKLHHLGLKEKQEREIIYVILNCCFQEQKFNPYYAALLQKFCEYDRKYQMTIQYTLWDKIKLVNSYTSQQVLNMAKCMSYLFIQKALPISILKIIQLEELDKVTLKLFKRIMLDILLHENTEICLQVFTRIASSEKLHQFKEGLRLFINYFLLKNLKKENLNHKKMLLLKDRIEQIDKILTTTMSKIIF